ncbi:hypothetical protein I5415_09280 [Citrobacter sp. FDAARGOS_156]|uniref:hypothetical protein n=1 Tax=unclassified Citrobacter TaxID=2644389 RepID=UPI00190236B8|nr:MULTISPECIES: hypothetical protein [unclassified Citrobacter]MBJ8888716.1 hypothetical protein [Citrobacter sp. FDAARGOS_156]MDM2924823.1 hypothetical protein [Citrobacter sp. Cpa228]
MMKKIIRLAGVFVAVLIASSVLSGAGVAFTETWYPAPEVFSKFILVISTMLFFVKILLKAANKF